MKSTQMEIETTKGNFSGNFIECVAWLEEYQPSHTTLVVDGERENMDTSLHWLDSMYVAIYELDIDID